MNNSYLQKGLNYFLQFLLIDINYEKKSLAGKDENYKKKGKRAANFNKKQFCNLQIF